MSTFLRFVFWGVVLAGADYLGRRAYAQDGIRELERFVNDVNNFEGGAE